MMTPKAWDSVALLVEDNDDDADLTLMAFEQAHITIPVVRVRDGAEALDYLFARGRYADRSPGDVPVVVLLDLNLPKISGADVLHAIRADRRTRRLPVVVLTSSAEDEDRLRCYDEYCNSYVQKPVDFDKFVRVSRELGLYWTEINAPPP